MVIDIDEYAEELDRAIQAWQYSVEYRGGGKAELIRFFSQKTVDDYWEDIKEEFSGRTVAGMSLPEARASIQSYMTKTIKARTKKADGLYAARAEFSEAMLRRLIEREEAKKTGPIEAWNTIQGYLKKGK